MLLMSNGRELSGVEPHATTVGASLDLDSMIFAGGKIVSVLWTLHEVRLAFRFDRARMGALPLFPQQVSVFPSEVFVFVPARFLLRHRVVAPSFECSWLRAISDVKKPLPPVNPSRRSAARSGWGMMPTTFPSALQMPAM